MATYAIGDVQGCFTTLERLLRRIEFDAGRDRLWLVGDLVNRGPSSLEVLRWAKSMGKSVVVVLGNHDLHLIARAEGLREPRKRDTFEDVLEAPDREALLEWLIGRPLFHREGDFVLVHAGLLPEWSLEEAEALAWEAQEALRSRRRYQLLERLEEGGASPRWGPDLADPERLRLVVDAFTRIRTLRPSGELCLDFAGPPQQAPEGCRPWFDLCSFPPGATVLFGHWAALGLHLGKNSIGLDTGCAWGRSLTALRLEDRRVFQEPSELAGLTASSPPRRSGRRERRSSFDGSRRGGFPRPNERRQRTMDRIVFACRHNAGRSQMAAAFFTRLADPRLASAISAGTTPSDCVHPEVLEVMKEVGIDLSEAKPQLLTTDLAAGARLLVTMGCGEECPYLPGVEVEDWPLPDPKGQSIGRVREIREEVQTRVVELVRKRRWERASKS